MDILLCKCVSEVDKLDAAVKQQVTGPKAPALLQIDEFAGLALQQHMGAVSGWKHHRCTFTGVISTPAGVVCSAIPLA